MVLLLMHSLVLLLTTRIHEMRSICSNLTPLCILSTVQAYSRCAQGWPGGKILWRKNRHRVWPDKLKIRVEGRKDNAGAGLRPEAKDGA